MAIVNLLKANYIGKLGQTVGAKWKDKSTLHTYTVPANPNTPDQQHVRTLFGAMTSYISLFSPQLKGLSALNTKGMSIRNAIIHINKESFGDVSFDPSTLKVAMGGLPPLTALTIEIHAASGLIDATWTPVTGATISSLAKIVVICLNKDSSVCAVGSALNSAGSMVVGTLGVIANPCDVFYYVLDYRGSAKVSSNSRYMSSTPV